MIKSHDRIMGFSDVQDETPGPRRKSGDHERSAHERERDEDRREHREKRPKPPVVEEVYVPDQTLNQPLEGKRGRSVPQHMHALPCSYI